jgi:hypothetical protein
MYFSKLELVLIILFGLFMAWMLVFGQTVEVQHGSELPIPGTEEYIHDTIIRLWNGLWD